MAIRPITHIELCAGVGMLGIGLKTAIRQLRTVAHVEREAYAAATLVARMESAALDSAPIWDDLATFDGRPWRGKVDCISAGFPCQPWSVAGKRAGTDDERWIWPDIARIIDEVQPAFVFLENVPGLASGGGVGPVLADLDRIGFDAEWDLFSAAEAGASHRRERLFILAYDRRCTIDSGDESTGRAPWSDFGWCCAWAAMGYAASLCEREPDGQDDAFATGGESRRISFGSGGSVADAEHNAGRSERRAESRGRQNRESHSKPISRMEREELADGPGPELADAEDQRGAGERLSILKGQPSEAVSYADWAGLPIFAPGPNDPRWGSIVRRAPHLEPAVRKLADGLAAAMAHRNDALRCVGNGVVPLQAALAFEILARRAGTK